MPMLVRRRTVCHGYDSAFHCRTGSSYIAVLGATLIIASMAYGGLLAVRSTVRLAGDFEDAAAARRCADAAIELGRLWIAQDANWRTTRSNGVWAANQPLLDGRYTLEVIDTIDGDLANRPHDPVRMTATTAKGRARHKIAVNLQADPRPLPALGYALHTAGELVITASDELNASGAKVSTNTSLSNSGTINANVEAGSASSLGTINGTVSLNVPPKVLPGAAVADHYAALGTQITTGATISLDVLGPGRNPWGSPNPEGVYVIRPSANLTISNSRVLGTLVIYCNAGSTVTITNNVLMQPYRNDYPALIVVGNAVFQHSAGLLALSETLSLKNFNPPGAPYEGSSDNDILDSFPSEIQGLVHVTGTVQLKSTGLLRGVLLGEFAGAEAVKSTSRFDIAYTPTLYANPPQWYTSQVFMRPESGSWRQVTE